jgi:hypothetical protein
MPGVGRRRLAIGSPHPLRGFGGRQNVKSCTIRASSVSLAGTNERQTVTITGTPTGGTWTLTFRGATTANIAYNATAAAVEDALELLSTIGNGRVRVTGGPGPGTPYVVDFEDALGRQDVSTMTASGASLTGGSSPAVAVVETTKGDATDAGTLLIRRGTIIKIDPTDSTKMVPYDNTGTIKGVLAQDHIFMDQSDISDTDLSYWGGPNCDFITNNLRGADGTYATYASNFATWAAANGNVLTTNP